MDYAMKMLTLPTPSSLSSSVTAGLSAGASMTQQLLTGRAPRPKPFRVSNADRSMKKGIMADTLEGLINKVSDSLNVACVGALVLDEDGTGVDTEEYFQTLPENAVLMVLEKECKWTPPPNSPSKDQLSELRPQQRRDVVKLTFDLYKNNPKDFIGCLNVKATMEVLRWAIFTMQATGHILLGSSGYIEQQLLEEDERAERRLELPQESRIELPQESRIELPQESRIELPQESRIELPQESRIRQLQSMLLARITH
ncbi:cell death activator CIDE-3-like isoform X2 [Gymnodraco acuticeps]|uniref:Cell death activator CIDE-3-like isoform X2 n=1 Tax=Gymnodraco acuticeps TaxID=8218 RepID=A0A6P8TVC3_GYMAC|nr:cell death activator CIDE-3-like isoform X2 [Gymnodraco acuticeps]